jgi:hypothetical protein
VSNYKTLIVSNEGFANFEGLCVGYRYATNEFRDRIFGHRIIKVPEGFAVWPLMIFGVEKSDGKQKWMVEEGQVSLFDPDDFPSVGGLMIGSWSGPFLHRKRYRWQNFMPCEPQDISDFVVQMDEYGYNTDDQYQSSEG